MHALRPMNPITTCKLCKMNYSLKVGQMFACLDEAATESGDFAILIKDAPTTSPRTCFCLNWQNLLEASVFNEKITIPPSSNIPTETVEDTRGETYDKIPGLAPHSRAPT